MNQLDVYYRALLNYRNAIESDNDCQRFNNAFISADADGDKLVVTRAFCTIDEEWVEEIEKGLVFIEKAIKEDRQFILSQGEVVPIEKVKSVSKESVQHLAKHSDLITEYEEGGDIVPDKLYTVERLNDYTVYENRLLANIAYFFNYEDSPNAGYFFVDLLEETGKLTKPPYDPKREGYEFAGWYTDKECTKRFNFFIDNVTIYYDEEGNRIYEEFCLYAKWDKK